MNVPEPYRLLLFLAGTMAFVGLNAAYLVWVERKGAGRFQRRTGPSEVGYAGCCSRSRMRSS
jgi:NADH-quinone oxidoreductase subunit H